MYLDEDDEQWKPRVVEEIASLVEVIDSLTKVVGVVGLLAGDASLQAGRVQKLHKRVNELEKKLGLTVSKPPPPQSKSFTDTLDAVTKILERLVTIAATAGRLLPP
jgi:hypothetical protein